MRLIFVDHFFAELAYIPIERVFVTEFWPPAIIASPFLLFKPQVTYLFDDNDPYCLGVFFLPRLLPQPSFDCLSAA